MFKYLNLIKLAGLRWRLARKFQHQRTRHSGAARNRRCTIRRIQSTPATLARNLWLKKTEKVTFEFRTDFLKFCDRREQNFEKSDRNFNKLKIPNSILFLLGDPNEASGYGVECLQPVYVEPNKCDQDDSHNSWQEFENCNAQHETYHTELIAMATENFLRALTVEEICNPN